MKKLAALAAMIAAIFVAAPSGAQSTDPSTIRVDYYDGKLLLGTYYEAHVPEPGDRVSLVVQSGDTHTTVTRTVALRRFVYGSRIIVNVTP